MHEATILTVCHGPQKQTCKSPEMTTSVTLASVVSRVSAPRRSSGDMADLQARWNSLVQPPSP
jgi:hypothetical protein